MGVIVVGVDHSEGATAALQLAVDEAQMRRSTCRVIERAPGAALVAESRAAELLVVGSRGHGGFAGLLLGSVGARCAHHADCPVVINPQRGEKRVVGRQACACLRAEHVRRGAGVCGEARGAT